MTIYSGWKLYIGSWREISYAIGTATVGNRPVDALDLTNLMLGAEVTMSCDFGKLGVASGTITLDNSAGSLTRLLYDMGYAYDDDREYNSDYVIEWFRAPVYLVPTCDLVDGTTEVGGDLGAGWFSGFVDGVEFDEDGFGNQITLHVIDWFTMAARYRFPDDVYRTADLATILQEEIMNVVPSPVFSADVIGSSLGTIESAP
ncbi:MAG: hypothetical protein ACO3VQ_02510 [Ilumatobacteraceae bacterium]